MPYRGGVTYVDRRYTLTMAAETNYYKSYTHRIEAVVQWALL